MTANPSDLSPSLPHRIPSLDGLRAIAIGLVILAHLVGTKNFPTGLALMEHLGNYGVRCFFIISGFLITTLLLRELAAAGTISLRDFYIRRCLRILPASYTYVGLVCLATTAGLIQLYPGDLLHAWTYTMNYQNIPLAVPHARANGWYLNHLWSLSVEEQFYLCWPAAIVLLTARRALKLAGAIMIAGPIIRVFMWYMMSPSSEDVITTALSRQFEAVSDALATGCVLAGAYNWLGMRTRYQAFLQSPCFLMMVPVIGIGLPTLVFLKSPVLFFVVSQSVLNITMALCLERCVRYPGGFIGAVLNAAPLTAVGVLSYSLYLWQEPFLNLFQRGALFAFPVNLMLVIGAALVSYYLVERPFLHLKTEFERNKYAAKTSLHHPLQVAAPSGRESPATIP